MSRILLVDGDIYAYQIACSDQTDAVFDGVEMSCAEFDVARVNLDAIFESFMERMEADKLLIALSDIHGGNFRRDMVLSSYKEKRAEVLNPLLRRQLEAHLRENYDTADKPGLEGDDILGIWATMPPDFLGKGNTRIVVSGDKDLKFTIPGHHWNPKKDENGKYVTITEEQADYGHLFQTLTGDPVDGYKGCPSIGPIKAKKILDTAVDTYPNDYWSAVVRTYEDRGLGYQDALTQARCARILRASDYDFDNKKPILWSPK